MNLSFSFPPLRVPPPLYKYIYFIFYFLSLSLSLSLVVMLANNPSQADTLNNSGATHFLTRGNKYRVKTERTAHQHGICRPFPFIPGNELFASFTPALHHNSGSSNPFIFGCRVANSTQTAGNRPFSSLYQRWP